MGNYFEPVLSEEQMAAYLDGMLSNEESNMVEDQIESSPEMVEIQNAIDSVDSTYLYEINEEIPIECMADDFSLPDIGYEYQHVDDSYHEEEFLEADYEDDHNDYQEESMEMGNDDSFIDNDFDDISL